MRYYLHTCGAALDAIGWRFEDRRPHWFWFVLEDVGAWLIRKGG